MKYIFIINSFTVKERINSIIHKIKSYCELNNYDYEIEINNKDNSTESIVKKYRHKKYIIVALGGDGMINRVLNSIVNTKNILSFIPCGTGNDFYKSALKDFKDGYNDCDLTKINNKYFINTVCFGIDAYTANNKKIMGNKHIPRKYKYDISAIDAFINYKPINALIKIDNKKIKGKFSTIVLCNGQYYGGGYNINPYSNLNNNLIDVYTCDYVSKISLLKLVLSMKKGNHIKSNKVKTYHTKKVKIIFDKKINSNIDGEELIDNKFNIEVLSKKQVIYFDKNMIEYISSL